LTSSKPTSKIKTPDGSCDAAFIHPKTGSYPGVLIWPDAFGLRPAMRDIAKRLAGEGYSVQVPNPFYRVSKAPFTDASNFDFQKPADMAKLRPLMASVNAPGNAEKDAAAYVAFLDAQKQVDKAKKIGTQGYCMGGALVVRTAAAMPNRIGAGASFHGGGLVTDKADSPHLLASKIKARMYFGVASNDDARQPDAKDKLKEAFAAAKVPAEIEVYSGALHGWCVQDMPMQNGVRSTIRPTLNVPGASSSLYTKRPSLDSTCLLSDSIRRATNERLSGLASARTRRTSTSKGSARAATHGWTLASTGRAARCLSGATEEIGLVQSWIKIGRRSRNQIP
jgi:carboxymethylenebutenolidase